jgi:hypothetical protein
MDITIDKLIRHIREKDIKIVTISESNHRSYTSHTFHYKLAKRLYEEGIINTFSSERMGVIDSMIINYYLEKGGVPKNLVEKLPFGGLGYSRIIKYLSKKDRNSYQIVGFEEDEYCKKAFGNLPESFFEAKLSPTFSTQIKRGVAIKKLKPINENDKIWYKSLKSFADEYNDNRETFWLKEMKKKLKERGNLFINGYHLAKGDKIGKYLEKEYPGKVLFLGMSASDITTQVLLVDGEDDFIEQVRRGEYEQKVENIRSICPKTSFENKIRKDWTLLKVDKKNEEERIGAIGCFVVISRRDYEIKSKVGGGYKIKKYDYVIFFKNSVYREKMFI